MQEWLEVVGWQWKREDSLERQQTRGWRNRENIKWTGLMYCTCTVLLRHTHLFCGFIALWSRILKKEEESKRSEKPAHSERSVAALENMNERFRMISLRDPIRRHSFRGDRCPRCQHLNRRQVFVSKFKDSKQQQTIIKGSSSDWPHGGNVACGDGTLKKHSTRLKRKKRKPNEPEAFLRHRRAKSWRLPSTGRST